jgi:EAL domain-containing protein (putative c-di-GMP-specific phosphodiesterase class I)/CheY-like chemotaxis protein
MNILGLPPRALGPNQLGTNFDMTYEHILIVDDDPLIHAVCKAFFERRQCKSVLTALSAMQGLQLINDRPEIDLVVSDLNMPDVDGLQFLRMLMEQRFRKPIVLLSGEDESVIRSAHKLADAHDLVVLGRVSKPLDPSVLEAVLATPVVDRKRRAARSTVSLTEADFHSALLLGEIRAYLQPLVACSTGTVVSAEALARWHHPEHGLIMPDSFIPMLEDAGLISKLTDYILSDALEITRTCANRGYSFRIAVNTDAETIKQLDFPNKVARIASRAGVPNDFIKFELTERSLLDEGPGTMEVLTRLRLQRFGLSIDDFGTGNSNLKQLCTFPFTELKIDKSFLDGISTDRAKSVCLNAIVSLANSLDLDTVAEGIETDEDFALVKEAGIRYAQGKLFSMPLAPDDFISWLEARQASSPLQQTA